MYVCTSVILNLKKKMFSKLSDQLGKFLLGSLAGHYIWYQSPGFYTGSSGYVGTPINNK